MRTANATQNGSRLDQLCASVREFVEKGTPEAVLPSICRAMEEYPHAPQPHNLMGIVLEKTGDHAGAMKHFRAAWALDPGYAPANHNLQTYGTFYSGGGCAYDESDVPAPGEGILEIQYDARGIGRAVYKARIEYDKHGIGHVVRSAL